MKLFLALLAFVAWAAFAAFWIVCAIGNGCEAGSVFERITSALNPLDKPTALLEFLFFMLGAFLLGVLFASLIGVGRSRTNTAPPAKVSRQKKSRIAQEMSAPADTPSTTASAPSAPRKKMDANDLTLINGVGPASAKQLNAIGIYSLSDVANLSAADAAKVTSALEFDDKLIERDDWRGQAKALLAQMNA